MDTAREVDAYLREQWRTLRHCVRGTCPAVVPNKRKLNADVDAIWLFEFLRVNERESERHQIFEPLSILKRAHKLALIVRRWKASSASEVKRLPSDRGAEKMTDVSEEVSSISLSNMRSIWMQALGVFSTPRRELEEQKSWIRLQLVDVRSRLLSDVNKQLTEGVSRLERECERLMSPILPPDPSLLLTQTVAKVQATIDLHPNAQVRELSRNRLEQYKKIVPELCGPDLTQWANLRQQQNRHIDDPIVALSDRTPHAALAFQASVADAEREQQAANRNLLQLLRPGGAVQKAPLSITLPDDWKQSTTPYRSKLSTGWNGVMQAIDALEHGVTRMLTDTEQKPRLVLGASTQKKNEWVHALSHLATDADGCDWLVDVFREVSLYCARWQHGPLLPPHFFVTDPAQFQRLAVGRPFLYLMSLLGFELDAGATHDLMQLPSVRAPLFVFRMQQHPSALSLAEALGTIQLWLVVANKAGHTTHVDMSAIIKIYDTCLASDFDQVAATYEQQTRSVRVNIEEETKEEEEVKEEKKKKSAEDDDILMSEEGAVAAAASLLRAKMDTKETKKQGGTKRKLEEAAEQVSYIGAKRGVLPKKVVRKLTFEQAEQERIKRIKRVREGASSAARAASGVWLDQVAETAQRYQLAVWEINLQMRMSDCCAEWAALLDPKVADLEARHMAAQLRDFYVANVTNLAPFEYVTSVDPSRFVTAGFEISSISGQQLSRWTVRLNLQRRANRELVEQLIRAVWKWVGTSPVAYTPPVAEPLSFPAPLEFQPLQPMEDVRTDTRMTMPTSSRVSSASTLTFVQDIRFKKPLLDALAAFQTVLDEADSNLHMAETNYDMQRQNSETAHRERTQREEKKFKALDAATQLAQEAKHKEKLKDSIRIRDESLQSAQNTLDRERQQIEEGYEPNWKDFKKQIHGENRAAYLVDVITRVIENANIASIGDQKLSVEPRAWPIQPLARALLPSRTLYRVNPNATQDRPQFERLAALTGIPVVNLSDRIVPILLRGQQDDGVKIMNLTAIVNMYLKVYLVNLPANTRTDWAFALSLRTAIWKDIVRTRYLVDPDDDFSALKVVDEVVFLAAAIAMNAEVAVLDNFGESVFIPPAQEFPTYQLPARLAVLAENQTDWEVYELNEKLREQAQRTLLDSVLKDVLSHATRAKMFSIKATPENDELRLELYQVAAESRQFAGESSADYRSRLTRRMKAWLRAVEVTSEDKMDPLANIDVMSTMSGESFVGWIIRQWYLWWTKPEVDMDTTLGVVLTLLTMGDYRWAALNQPELKLPLGENDEVKVFRAHMTARIDWYQHNTANVRAATDSDGLKLRLNNLLTREEGHRLAALQLFSNSQQPETPFEKRRRACRAIGEVLLPFIDMVDERKEPKVLFELLGILYVFGQPQGTQTDVSMPLFRALNARSDTGEHSTLLWDTNVLLNQFRVRAHRLFPEAKRNFVIHPKIARLSKEAPWWNAEFGSSTSDQRALGSLADEPGFDRLMQLISVLAASDQPVRLVYRIQFVQFMLHQLAQTPGALRRLFASAETKWEQVESNIKATIKPLLALDLTARIKGLSFDGFDDLLVPLHILLYGAPATIASLFATARQSLQANSNEQKQWSVLFSRVMGHQPSVAAPWTPEGNQDVKQPWMDTALPMSLPTTDEPLPFRKWLQTELLKHSDAGGGVWQRLSSLRRRQLVSPNPKLRSRPSAEIQAWLERSALWTSGVLSFMDEKNLPSEEKVRTDLHAQAVMEQIVARDHNENARDPYYYASLYHTLETNLLTAIQNLRTVFKSSETLAVQELEFEEDAKGAISNAAEAFRATATDAIANAKSVVTDVRKQLKTFTNHAFSVVLRQGEEQAHSLLSSTTTLSVPAVTATIAAFNITQASDAVDHFVQFVEPILKQSQAWKNKLKSLQAARVRQPLPDQWSAADIFYLLYVGKNQLGDDFIAWQELLLKLSHVQLRLQERKLSTDVSPTVLVGVRNPVANEEKDLPRQYAQLNINLSELRESASQLLYLRRTLGAPERKRAVLSVAKENLEAGRESKRTIRAFEDAMSQVDRLVKDCNILANSLPEEMKTKVDEPITLNIQRVLYNVQQHLTLAQANKTQVFEAFSTHLNSVIKELQNGLKNSEQAVHALLVEQNVTLQNTTKAIGAYYVSLLKMTRLQQLLGTLFGGALTNTEAWTQFAATTSNVPAALASFWKEMSRRNPRLEEMRSKWQQIGAATVQLDKQKMEFVDLGQWLKRLTDYHGSLVNGDLWKAEEDQIRGVLAAEVKQDWLGRERDWTAYGLEVLMNVTVQLSTDIESAVRQVDELNSKTTTFYERFARGLEGAMRTTGVLLGWQVAANVKNYVSQQEIAQRVIGDVKSGAKEVAEALSGGAVADYLATMMDKIKSGLGAVPIVNDHFPLVVEAQQAIPAVTIAIPRGKSDSGLFAGAEQLDPSGFFRGAYRGAQTVASSIASFVSRPAVPAPALPAAPFDPYTQSILPPNPFVSQTTTLGWPGEPQTPWNPPAPQPTALQSMFDPQPSLAFRHTAEVCSIYDSDQDPNLIRFYAAQSIQTLTLFGLPAMVGPRVMNDILAMTSRAPIQVNPAKLSLIAMLARAGYELYQNQGRVDAQTKALAVIGLTVSAYASWNVTKSFTKDMWKYMCSTKRGKTRTLIDPKQPLSRWNYLFAGGLFAASIWSASGQQKLLSMIMSQHAASSGGSTWNLGRFTATYFPSLFQHLLPTRSGEWSTVVAATLLASSKALIALNGGYVAGKHGFGARSTSSGENWRSVYEEWTSTIGHAWRDTRSLLVQLPEQVQNAGTRVVLVNSIDGLSTSDDLLRIAQTLTDAHQAPLAHAQRVLLCVLESVAPTDSQWTSATERISDFQKSAAGKKLGVEFQLDNIGYGLELYGSVTNFFTATFATPPKQLPLHTALQTWLIANPSATPSVEQGIQRAIPHTIAYEVMSLFNPVEIEQNTIHVRSVDGFLTQWKGKILPRTANAFLNRALVPWLLDKVYSLQQEDFKGNQGAIEKLVTGFVACVAEPVAYGTLDIALDYFAASQLLSAYNLRTLQKGFEWLRSYIHTGVFGSNEEKLLGVQDRSKRFFQQRRDAYRKRQEFLVAVGVDIAAFAGAQGLTTLVGSQMGNELVMYALGGPAWQIFCASSAAVATLASELLAKQTQPSKRDVGGWVRTFGRVTLAAGLGYATSFVGPATLVFNLGTQFAQNRGLWFLNRKRKIRAVSVRGLASQNVRALVETGMRVALESTEPTITQEFDPFAMIGLKGTWGKAPSDNTVDALQTLLESASTDSNVNEARDLWVAFLCHSQKEYDALQQLGWNADTDATLSVPDDRVGFLFGTPM